MSNVYIVTAGLSPSDSWIVGIYAAKESADDAAREFNEKQERQRPAHLAARFSEHADVEEHELKP